MITTGLNVCFFGYLRAWPRPVTLLLPGLVSATVNEFPKQPCTEDPSRGTRWGVRLRARCVQPGGVTGGAAMAHGYGRAIYRGAIVVIAPPPELLGWF
jgi:hypothetical protein